MVILLVETMPIGPVNVPSFNHLSTCARMRRMSSALVRQQPPIYSTPSESHSSTYESTDATLSGSVHLENI